MGNKTFPLKRKKVYFGFVNSDKLSLAQKNSAFFFCGLCGKRNFLS
jgi:hypothetical protein